MNFVSIAEEKLNVTLTENGDKAYHTSGSFCVDFFSLCGGMRDNLEKALPLFIKAMNEDHVTATKLLFYLRDIRGGLGERNEFRFILNTIGHLYPDIARKIVPYIPRYGRCDDLLGLLTTPVEDDVISLIKYQLGEDVENKRNGKPISLLAKWLPSINTSSKETRELALYLVDKLGVTKKEYRQTLSFLRKDLIIENNLRVKDYASINYSHVPGCAFLKYRNAFFRKDYSKFSLYLMDVKNGKEKINSDTLFPYQIVHKIITNQYDESLDVIWNDMVKGDVDSKTIVVRDGSGSMYVGINGVDPIEIATSLAILFAEKLTGPFHNKFITFSESPEMITVLGNNIKEKVINVNGYHEVANTNIEKVYDLILDVYKSPDFTKDDYLDSVVIISDMEFDECARVNNQNPFLGTHNDYYNQKFFSTFEKFKTEFNELGYEMPRVVFWNVNARNVHTPVKEDETGVALVSGASKNIIDLVSKGGVNPREFMFETLKKYSFVDELLK